MKSKQLPKFNPDGPEKKFKGKMQEPDSFEPGSRNVMKVKTSGTAVLKVRVDKQSWEKIPDIDHSTSFDINEEGVSVLIGRLNRDDSLGIPVDELISLISDPERIQAILVNRIEYVRNDIKKRMEWMEKDKVLLEELKNPRPNATRPGFTVEDVEERMDRRHLSMQENVRKVEVLKEVLSEGSLTHVLHVLGGATFSSTHAILSIKPDEITFIPLQDGQGECIDAQNYGLGGMLAASGARPSVEVKISIEFK